MADAANAGFVHRTFDRARLASLADWLAVGVAAALPWVDDRDRDVHRPLAARAASHPDICRSTPGFCKRRRRPAGIALARRRARNSLGACEPCRAARGTWRISTSFWSSRCCWRSFGGSGQRQSRCCTDS